MKGRISYALTTVLTWCFAIALTSFAVWCVGDSPTLVLKVLALSAAGSLENLSYTLYYATPMLLTGTAVALALEAGLFNIGAEGQLYMGALAAACWAAVTRGWFGAEAAALSIDGLLTIAVGAVCAFSGGAIWGGIAGYLRTRRQTHEVIATIMLNFVAFALVNWAILNPLKNHDTQNLETVGVAEALRTPRLWHQSTIGFPLALAIAIVAMWAVKRTWWGFRVRATGQNATAAKVAGINVSNTAFLTMALSGGIAGLVGFQEVFLSAYKLVDGFSAGYGFTGLAIALLARGSTTGLVLSALLFGALHKGALDLDLETEKVTRDLSAVIQALVLLALTLRNQLARIPERLFR